MSLKILVVAPQPFFIQRGTPIAVRMLLQSLGEAGHRCDAIVFPEGEDVDLPNVQVIRAPRVPGTKGMPPGFSLKKLLVDAAMFPMLAWRLLRHRYDLVIAVEEAAFMTLVLKPFFRVPYIYDIDSSIPEQINDKFGLPSWLNTALTAAERTAVRGSIGAIPCCQALGDIVRDYAPTLPVQTLEDVSLVDFDAETAPPEGWSYESPVLMYIGNLEGYQGVGLLIEGFAKAVADGTEAHLVVIGGTPDTIETHRALADRTGAGDKITFTGPRPVEEIARYMAQATIVASPRTQGRNTPMKVYSYLDSGRPLLATRLPTHTQVLDDDIAMLVDPTPEDMARGISALLADPDLRDRLARQAAERVRAEFSPAAYRRKLTGFLENEIIPRLRRRAPAAGAT